MLQTAAWAALRKIAQDNLEVKKQRKKPQRYREFQILL